MFDRVPADDVLIQYGSRARIAPRLLHNRAKSGRKYNRVFIVAQATTSIL